MVENVSCIEWLKKVPLHKKILTAATIGLILLVIVVLAIVFATKEGKYQNPLHLHILGYGKWVMGKFESKSITNFTRC